MVKIVLTQVLNPLLLNHLGLCGSHYSKVSVGTGKKVTAYALACN